jgi:hypothetical protein
MALNVFLSYQTADKKYAGQLKTLLGQFQINCFLAHEDIAVSEEWRLQILDQIGRANIFICLLSKHYILSPWCVQESGIAAYRKDMTIIPLSLDGTIPLGFIHNYQSIKVNPEEITIRDLIPGILKSNFAEGIELLINLVKQSTNFRNAESNFLLILPHLSNMSDPQIKLLLECSAKNGQVREASLCAVEYLPPLLKTHGHLLETGVRGLLEDSLKRNAL